MENTQTTTSTSWIIIIGIIAVTIIGAVIWLYPSQDDKKVIVEPIIEEVTPLIQEPEAIERTLPEVVDSTPVAVVEEEVIEPIKPIKPVLPSLNESDSWLQEKLPSITWRKELLKLVIDEDMIRRLVVFTDNFAQGVIAYEHSPLIKPGSSFSAIETNKDGELVLLWDETSSRRFSLYVDLLRSVDSDTLVSWYFELKPLIDQAYQVLGY